MKDKPREIILEQHLFAGDPNQFRCSKCAKPRCFHPEPIRAVTVIPKPITHLEEQLFRERHIRSTWRCSGTIGPLTDKKILHYHKEGYYSIEIKEARKEFLERKYKHRGSFIDMGEGRLIYRP